MGGVGGKCIGSTYWKAVQTLPHAGVVVTNPCSYRVYTDEAV